MMEQKCSLVLHLGKNKYHWAIGDIAATIDGITFWDTKSQAINAAKNAGIKVSKIVEGTLTDYYLDI